MRKISNKICPIRENMERLKYLLTLDVDRKLSDNELTDSSFDGPKVCKA